MAFFKEGKGADAEVEVVTLKGRFKSSMSNVVPTWEMSPIACDMSFKQNRQTECVRRNYSIALPAAVATQIPVHRLLH